MLFLSCFSDIENRLSKMVKPSETDWCICVVHHFLKELSVNRQYRIDKDSRYKGIFCPCCDDLIGDECFSDCSLGK